VPRVVEQGATLATGNAGRLGHAMERAADGRRQGRPGGVKLQAGAAARAPDRGLGLIAVVREALGDDPTSKGGRKPRHLKTSKPPSDPVQLPGRLERQYTSESRNATAVRRNA